jgi:hypothetical protein
MDLYLEPCYKKIIRQRVKELNAEGRKTTLKKLAERIPVQYTYLSRTLGSADKHLSEDHLFIICNQLELPTEETEYLLLLRAHDTTFHPARRKHLLAKLEHLRTAKKLRASLQEFNSQNLSKEIDYLFDPLCIIVHASLGIEEYRQNPHRLCSLLGFSRERLRETLRKLRDLDFIELDEAGNVKKTKSRHIHYSSKHPLMRAHQNMLRNLSLHHLSKTEEEHKHNFMVTFSAEPETFQSIKDLFQKFLEEVEKKVVTAKCQNTFQMNFDLFKWL